MNALHLASHRGDMVLLALMPYYDVPYSDEQIIGHAFQFSAGYAKAIC